MQMTLDILRRRDARPAPRLRSTPAPGRATALALAPVLALALLAGQGCGLLDFDISEELPERRVAGFDPLSPLLDATGFFPPLSMGLDLSQELAARDTGPARSVHLKSLTLHITETGRSSSTDEDTFDFLDVLRLYIAGAQGSSLPRLLLAELDPVPDGQTTLELPVDGGIDLKPYLEEGHLLSSEIAGFPPPDEVTYAGTIVITVRF